MGIIYFGHPIFKNHVIKMAEPREINEVDLIIEDELTVLDLIR